VSAVRTDLLGFIASVTIFLGMPLARLRSPRPSLKLFLSATAIGVLLFLVWDVLSHGFAPIDDALIKLHDHTGGLAPVWGYGALFFGGLTTGLMTLVYYERYLGRRAGARPSQPTPPRAFGPGAMTVGELDAPTRSGRFASPARQLALLIAVGIGLHNFGEGLAIGNAAGSGAISLATLLVIGFALHNATEGFGIIAPLTSDAALPSWRYLFGLGLIGGAPTFVGTVIGRSLTSTPISVLFLTLAAGSILYVVFALLKVAERSGRRELLMWGVLLGLFLGFATDMVVTAAGA